MWLPPKLFLVFTCCSNLLFANYYNITVQSGILYRLIAMLNTLFLLLALASGKFTSMVMVLNTVLTYQLGSHLDCLNSSQGTGDLAIPINPTLLP